MSNHILNYRNVLNETDFSLLLEQQFTSTGLHAYGLTFGAMQTAAWTIAGHFTDKPCIIITEDEKKAKDALDFFQELFDDRDTLLFPSLAVYAYEMLAQSNEAEAMRLRCLSLLRDKKPGIVIVPARALVKAMPEAQLFYASFIEFAVNDEVDIKSFTEKLISLGYERTDIVEGRGQFCIKGGIVDVFSPQQELAYRLELWGDTIESIRLFDAVTQISQEKADAVLICPAREFIFDREVIEQGNLKVRKAFSKAKSALAKKATGDKDAPLHATGLQQKEFGFDICSQYPYAIEGLAQYLPYYCDSYGFLSYIPEGSPVIFMEIDRVRDAIEAEFRELIRTIREQVLAGKALPEQKNLYQHFDDIFREAFSRLQLFGFTQSLSKIAGWDSEVLLEFKTRQNLRYFGERMVAASDIARMHADGYKIIIAARDERKAEMTHAYLMQEEAVDLSGAIYGTVVFPLREGFIDESSKISVLTPDELLARGTGRKKTPAKKKAGVFFASFSDIKENDFVVHLNHGVGRYVGIENIDAGGMSRDYLLIQYSGGDKLYVPTDQITMLQKYVGSDENPPKVGRLGGKAWQAIKEKAQGSVREMAEQLLALYAKRAQTPGFSFGPDTPWQFEFEDAFPYDETVDQLRAIEEIKQDMEMPKAMDRLLCGDVGYGKTEVALRAAFKAVMDGKQVAVLVPTTILAQQHFTNFTERFARFPVKVDVLSRFRTVSEQKKTVESLRDGRIDVVIGTHRLLASDIRFKDLGLLVVDEEQKFGVTHKESIKQMKANVDVLTLSATPIPRTLYMSLTGARDVSVIETPPENRFPVQTFVMEHAPDVVRDAVKREVVRGGQIYYVYNRIRGIDRIVRDLKAMVPGLRVAVGHGQMDEDELEAVMVDFAAGEYDILVCTTIIENGLDIANANTIIVDNADKMGLSQLYQLRGRVGRSNRVAYAYFLYQMDKQLTEIAEKRLRAIRDFTEFGSGFKIAMRDLEIRGAGNLLGAEQHGHISSVGFELYCQLLEDAVAEAKGEEKPTGIDPQIEIPIDAFIPDEYVPDVEQKIDLYKRLATCMSEDDLEVLRNEFIDRFGKTPLELQNLFMLMKIRLIAVTLRITALRADNGKIRIVFEHGKNISESLRQRLLKKIQNRLVFQNGPPQRILLDMKPSEIEASLKTVFNFIRMIRKLQNETNAGSSMK